MKLKDTSEGFETRTYYELSQSANEKFIWSYEYDLYLR